MKKLSLFLLITLLILQCGTSSEESNVQEQEIEEEVWVKNAPLWTKSANIYEVNVRQHTTDGTFRALLPHMDRLSKMGVDIIWLMPVYPIGELNRKGGLGSPYSVKDYKAVNPEFGNLDDFKNLVKKIHALDMKVIIDWVPNHTAWDNPWTKNKDWYLLEDGGNFQPPLGTDWTDVIQLDYSNEEMRQAMIDAMKWWVKETDIDGFREDVAGKVPLDFWLDCRQQLDEVKDIFFLAEADEEGLHEAFDASYAWSLHHSLNEVAKGRISPQELLASYKEDGQRYKSADYRMQFVTNHDENSWNGTINERMGRAGDACYVMTLTTPGIPLLYSGQEAGLNKRLAFFEKDNIDWSDLSKAEFYKEMLKLKHDHAALWNGDFGGDFVIHGTDNEKVVFFSRNGENDAVHVLINFSNAKQVVSSDMLTVSEWKQELMEGSSITIDKEGTRVSMDPWSYAIFSAK
ncbi:MAG: alpha-amylase family glycosyl hydrolase [Bacteroidota bacterium]